MQRNGDASSATPSSQPNPRTQAPPGHPAPSSSMHTLPGLQSANTSHAPPIGASGVKQAPGNRSVPIVSHILPLRQSASS